MIGIKVGYFGSLGGSSDERWDKKDRKPSSLPVIGARHLVPTDASLSANVGSFPKGWCSLNCWAGLDLDQVIDDEGECGDEELYSRNYSLIILSRPGLKGAGHYKQVTGQWEAGHAYTCGC